MGTDFLRGLDVNAKILQPVSDKGPNLDFISLFVLTLCQNLVNTSTYVSSGPEGTQDFLAQIPVP